ncbi:MlaA family lipoprotein [Muricoccus pecuniae]|uniref:Phospholipid-binding lipoprotein MlaA n=1 Tax=Muricoccus pecuniae TaxID=693023 RepID=A0A840YEJ0_9PROT|nr:VacJ family lipoprotein [Roseomonas pecuniae]MBB5692294.1 phospholipid-binding lipoprotein MlaA [Roseomonas pecuniae]
MRLRLLILPLILSLGACATRGAEGEAATPGDPLEPVNRQVLDANLAVDDAVLRPVALGYREVVPEYARNRVRSFLDNLSEPRIFANNILQGRLLDAGHTTMRFFFNSTVGIGGLYDVATDFGIARRTGDFGQTLHSWGVESGPYLMLPLAGPSNTRDTVGMVSDGFLNPISWLLPFEANIARTAVAGVDLREQNIEGLDALRSGSLDFYARLRSVWQQRRDAELGRTGDAGDRIDVLEDPGGGLNVLDDPGAAR